MTMLIILTILHWIVAYVIGYLIYDPNNSKLNEGIGSLWIPVIGWMFIWLLVIFEVIMYLESPGFKTHFYGKKR